MRGYSPRVYKSRKTLRVVILSVLIALAIVVITLITMFFGLRKYAVYEDDGVHLEIPWLQDGGDQATADTESGQQ